MITRATGSIAVFSVSLAILALFDFLAEAFDDGLSDAPIPSGLLLIDVIAPIGWLIVILPISIAVMYWILRKDQTELSPIIWHGLIIAGSYFVLSLGIAASGYFEYLDGRRDITLARIIGNGFICAVVGAGIVTALRTQRRAQQTSDGNAEKPLGVERTQ